MYWLLQESDKFTIYKPYNVERNSAQLERIYTHSFVGVGESGNKSI